MELKVTKRATERKSQAKQARLRGLIPAVVYRNGKPGEPILVSVQEYKSRLATVPSGRLSTSKFTLIGEDGQQFQALLKEIQYHPTTYDVVHLDFQQLVENEPIRVNVPIECVKVAECLGVKQGGVLRQVIRHLRVHCLPKHIPAVLTMDVGSLEMKQTRRLKELAIPQEVRPIADLNEVAVVIAKR